MGFRKLPGNQGMIYIPDRRKIRRKHPCPDCFACHWCSNDRCLSCRPTTLKKIIKRVKQI